MFKVNNEDTRTTPETFPLTFELRRTEKNRKEGGGI